MDSDDETLLLVLLLNRKKILEKEKKKKPMKTLPLFCISQRTEFHKVKGYCDQKFQNYSRLTRKQFYELLPRLEPYIGKQNTSFKNTICAEERLFITLRYLAEGCSLTNLYHTYNRGLSTICAIVNEVCQAIYEILHTIYIPELKEEDWLVVANGFYNKANFPNCLGAIDGKHIRIIKPAHTGSLYYNYKKYLSIVLIAICDSENCFTNIDVGSYGKASDSQIFKNSNFYKSLQEQRLNISSPLPITSNGQPVPFVFMGDEAFGISNFIQRLYAGNYLNEKKRIFNYRLSRARRYIECSFGIMANKWRILHRPINVQVPFAEDIIRACCVLHNFLRKTDSKSSISKPIALRYDLQNMQRNDNNHTQLSASTVRDTLADYFVSPEGELSWQTMKI